MSQNENNSNRVKLGSLFAQRVVFKKSIQEFDFVERGMQAWFVDWKESHTDDYELFFDFTDFEAENDKYFKCDYHPNMRTQGIADATGRKLFTAKEAGYYHPKHKIGIYVPPGDTLEDVIQEYLELVN